MKDEVRIGESMVIVRYDPQIKGLNDWLSQDVRFELARFKEEDAFKNRNPYLISRGGYPDIHDGMLLDLGGNYIWRRLRDATSSTADSNSNPAVDSTHDFSNSHARIGVGDSSTAASVSQSDLQGTNKTRISMDSGFPLIQGETYVDSTGATITVANRAMAFRSTFGSSDHNFGWKEFGIFNGGATTGAKTSGVTMLDRFASDQGSKASGQIWEITITLTLA